MQLSGQTWCLTFVTVPHAGGRLMGAGNRRGRSRPQNDTWIAACCLEPGLPLATNNVQDFAGLAEHEGLKLITA